MQIKNKQLEGYKDLSASYVMATSQNLLISADGIEVSLPAGQAEDFFFVFRKGDWTGSTTYTASPGFTVDGASSISIPDSTSEVKFVMVGTNWVSFQTSVIPILAPGSLIAANACVGSPILVPTGNSADIRTVGTTGRYATFVQALADATVVAGTILRAISNTAETAIVNVTRAVVIDLNGFTVTNATSVTVFSLTAALAVIRGGTLHHSKVTNTSIETVVSINIASGVAFLVDNTIKVQEFGVLVQGGAVIVGNKFQYVGASQTNSHRFIAIYKITSETRIDNNEFTCSTIPATSRYSNFIYMSATAGSTWTAPLYVTRNTQTGGSLRQFLFNDALVPTTGSQLIVASNVFNDFNGGVGVFGVALYNGLDKIVIADNHQGADSLGNFKGLFFIDATGTLDNDTVFVYGGNTTAAGPLRADYLSMAADTTNIVAAKNTVVQPTLKFEQVSVEAGLAETGVLLQEIKGRRTYLVDGDGNAIPGFGTEDQPYVIEQAESATPDPTGFQSISSTIGFGTLIGYDPLYEFDSLSTTFTITPLTEQVIWVNGERFLKTSPESITVSGDGLKFIYYNTSGVLSVKDTPFDLSVDAPVSYVYRHAGKVILIGDERHGITMDSMTHEYLHRTRGAAYASGFGANGFTLTGTGVVDSDAQLNLAGGDFYDEDLKISIHDGTGGYFTQPLEVTAKLPVFYHVNGGWEAKKATTIPAITAGTGRLAYNLKTGSVWSITEVQNNHFGIMFIIATNSLLSPVMAVMGQSDYGSKGAAEAVLYNDVDLDGFPFYEFRPLYKIIYEVKDSYSNSVKAAIRGVIDLRTVVSSGMGTSAAQVNDHGSLTGLLDDDHPQYLNEIRADLRYMGITWETVNKNLVASGAVGVKDPVTGLMQTITYANGIVKTFTWNVDSTVNHITLSGSLPAGLSVTTKSFVWSSGGFTASYS